MVVQPAETPIDHLNHENQPDRQSCSDTLKAPFFRVRLINIDHVLTYPGCLDRVECAFNAHGQPLRKVPILRIFGATPAGQRACLHVHNVFPYCYIQYAGTLEPEHVLQYIHRLGRELNTAMALSLHRDPHDPDANQFIAAIHLCKGIKFYGYHVGYSYFLKISFIDPSHNYRLATILESGGVMKTVFQPYEVHIRYQLQFMLDYNLFGCDYIDLDHGLFRLPIPQGDNIASDHLANVDLCDKIWNRNSIPYSCIHTLDVPRNSHCQLELDASAPWITNRRRLKARDLHHDFDKHLAENSDQEKLVPSLRSLWQDEKKRRAAAALPPSIPVPDTAADKRIFQQGESPAWMSEERMRLLLSKRLADERCNTVERETRPDHFTKRHTLDQYIMTTLDAVQVFHPYDETDIIGNSPLERSGPSPSARLYDLNYSMTQGATGAPSQHLSDQHDQDIDAEFFQSQLFTSQLEDAEAVGQQMQDLQPDDEDGEYDDNENDGKPDPNIPQNSQGVENATVQAVRSFKRTNSASSTEPSLVDSSPTASPHKKLKIPSRQDSPSSTTVDSSNQPPQSLSYSDIETLPFTSSVGCSSILPKNNDHESSIQKNGRPTPPRRPFRKARQRASRVRFSSQAATVSQMQPESASVSTLERHSTSPLSSETVKASQTQDSLPKQRSDDTVPLFVFHQPAPTRTEVAESFDFFNLVRQVHQDPYFSNPADVPDRAREYAGRMFKLQSDSLFYLEQFQHWENDRPNVPSNAGESFVQRFWQFGPPPPSLLEVRAWQHREATTLEDRSRKRRQRLLSQIETSTQVNEYGFKISQHQPTSLVPKEKQHMTILSLEVRCCTRGSLLPDPGCDPIQAIIYSFQNEDDNLQDTGSRPDIRTGLLIVSQSDIHVDRLGLNHLALETVEDELELFNALIDLVRAFDPEILVGWEIHSASWGYILERAMKEYAFDLVPELGRVIHLNTGRAGGKSDNFAWTQSSALRITGRHVLNVWRLMKGELSLNVYSLENVCYHLLHKRVPKFAHQTLTEWYLSGRPELIARALKYYVDVVELVLEVIQESEFIIRTAEFARIYGVDFFSVISRGSQFKVESIMFRIAKLENFVLISPNRAQVGKQNAAECLPLILEPQSAFYKGPLLVLDFQSLYPSIMIAYNICYSTCLGRVSEFKATSKLGVTEYTPPKGLLSLLQDHVNISANGLLFVKPSVRKSLLAKMLSEILDTRVMVKGSMKDTKSDKAFQKIQNARQLSLKLLANVTYGYTSASFSGRMPCVEIADAIVQCGRETLEKAMDLINGTEKWGAQVVYGDTDSLFVYLPGRTKDEAFQIGYEMADKVTEMNPRPIKLKFEKVYLPSVLLAKKRYVGFKFETRDQMKPGLDAKGIETIRRDGHPALQRIMEACLRILFRSRDLSAVKSFCQRQWKTMLEGRVSVQDFIFSKEVKLGSYSDKIAPPPGAAVASRKMLLDPRSEPQYGERVPYIITQGEPKAKLNAQAVSPEVMLRNPSLQININYYITRTIIPPLARVFNLLGADVESWLNEMAKPVNVYWSKRPSSTTATTTTSTTSTNVKLNPQPSKPNLNRHYSTDTCFLCHTRTESILCLDCSQSPTSSVHQLIVQRHLLEKSKTTIESICSTCSQFENIQQVDCISLDCPLVYSKCKIQTQLQDLSTIEEHVSKSMNDSKTREKLVNVTWNETTDPS